MKATLMLILAAAAVLPAADDTIVRVPEPEAKKALVTRMDPAYPPMAKQMRLTGRVQVDAYIDETGAVEKVQVVNGNPLLTSAAVSAVKKWKFNAFTANGKAVKAVAAFTFDFKL